jgi:hypothetical protein
MRRAILTILNMLLITTAAVQVDAALERHAGSDYRGRTARPRGIIRAMEASSWTRLLQRRLRFDGRLRVYNWMCGPSSHSYSPMRTTRQT